MTLSDPLSRRASLLGLPLALSALAAAPPVQAQEGRPARPPSPEELMARLQRQREAIQPLSRLDGRWRGEAWFVAPNGQRVMQMTQTERVGPFLGGGVRVIEGAGYDGEGRLRFNALGILSFNLDTGRYGMRSYAQGHEADCPVELTPDGLRWYLEAQNARYTIVLRDGTWHEIGERVLPGQPVTKFFEMKLTRLGDSEWPAAGAVVPK